LRKGDTPIPEPTAFEYAEAKQKASTWAKERLHDRNTLIIDTETTGILSKEPETEVVQISIINTKGQPVLSLLVNPGRPVPLVVQKIHGITTEDVRDAPTFKDIAPLLYQTLEGKHLVAYNAKFDIHLVCHLFQKYKCPIPKFEVSCAMEEYSKWCGVWWSSKDSYRWQKLPKLAYGKAHDALTDCMSTLELLKLMAYERQTDDTELVSLDF
jgi:DNA polymerase III epsilon subunit-like protein